MPAFTSIMLGVSALAGVAGVSNAQKAAKAQAARQKAQSAAAKTKAREAGALESQDAGDLTANTVLGSGDDAVSSTLKPAALKDLEKQALDKAGVGSKVGGLGKSKAKIGGL
jgi:hypothetical protein